MPQTTLDDLFNDGPRIYNIRTDTIPDGAINVMRPSCWGNPFKVLSEKDRDWACDKFEEYVLNDSEFQAKIKKELRGKNLVCCCFPKRCHAMTLLRIANE